VATTSHELTIGAHRVTEGEASVCDYNRASAAQNVGDGVLPRVAASPETGAVLAMKGDVDHCDLQGLAGWVVHIGQFFPLIEMGDVDQ
jgi:hypothetical protein